ncbi:MAG: hypothetical protein WC099_02505 [Candidatus Paceibacterota bacterium]
MEHIHGLSGPYILTVQEIARVAQLKKPGAFAFGSLDERGTFIPRVLGMSSMNVSQRLREGIGTYTYFKVRYTSSAHDAFCEWCCIYHMFCSETSCPLEKREHPEHPQEESWKCPVCHAR